MNFHQYKLYVIVKKILPEQGFKNEGVQER